MKTESEVKFARLFQISAAPKSISRLSDGRILAINDSFVRFFGYSREELIGRTSVELGLWKSAAERKRIMRQALSAGHAMEANVAVRKRSGEVRHCNLTVDVIDTRAGKQVLSAIVDITDQLRAEADLKRAHDELELKVRERTAQLRALTAELVRVEEKERARIADVLHDDLQQILVAANYTLGSMDHARPPERRRMAAKVGELLQQALGTTRFLATALRPPALYEVGVGAALSWLAGEMKERQGLTVHLRTSEHAEPAASELRVFIFRAVRELLTNAVEHSGAKAAAVRMSLTREGRIRVNVKDSGRGFDTARSGSSGLGLFSIRERCGHLGGDVRIASRPGKGTCVTLTLPPSLPRPAKQGS